MQFDCLIAARTMKQETGALDNSVDNSAIADIVGIPVNSTLPYSRPVFNFENILQTFGFIMLGLPLTLVNLPIFGVIITRKALRLALQDASLINIQSLWYYCVTLCKKLQ